VDNALKIAAGKLRLSLAKPHQLLVKSGIKDALSFALASNSSSLRARFHLKWDDSGFLSASQTSRTIRFFFSPF
jgi:hypothetical protein